MSARVLTDQEYAKLAGVEKSKAKDVALAQMKQVHRLLCEGRAPETLTPVEQMYAVSFEGMKFAQIPNDYGWEPGVEVAEVGADTAELPKPKPKKSEK